MRYFIGMDLGTSALKALLVSETGQIIAETSQAYPVSVSGVCSEQDPEDWMRAVRRALAELSAAASGEITGIALGGQMHGLVALDEAGEVIRPCILWNDGRTEAETAYLNETVGEDVLLARTANIAFAGFTAPKLLWMRTHEAEKFARIRHILLPKDYVVYRLTGEFSSDYSDASGTLMLDVANKRWSEEMCAVCGVQPAWLPSLHESWEIVGRVRPEFGLPNAVVCAGAGDNAAAAIGTGTVRDGQCNISLGTSGTVFIPCGAPDGESGSGLHFFAHANGRWHRMGCILSAASANRWWIEDILGSGDYEGETAGAQRFLAENSVFFLPYLSGERSPINDVRARGCFLGLNAQTTRAQMSLAVLEGVSFALKSCLEIARAEGAQCTLATVCGGGAKSALWRKILANVLDLPVAVPVTEQGPALGAAILAMTGCGVYPDVASAADAFARTGETVMPDPALAARYAERYAVYARLYPALKDVFPLM